MNSERSGSFLCKKWSLFSVALLGIIGCIVMASIASSLVEAVAKNNSSDYTNDVKSMAKSIIIAAAVIGILFHLLGLLGAFKEHFCMTMTYAILMALGSLGSISIAVKTPSYWYSTVLYFVITGLAFAFARDLHILRNRMFATTMIVSPVQPQTVVHIAPGYSGHQYQSQSAGWQPPPPPAYTSDTNSYK